MVGMSQEGFVHEGGRKALTGRRMIDCGWALIDYSVTVDLTARIEGM